MNSKCVTDPLSPRLACKGQLIAGVVLGSLKDLQSNQSRGLPMPGRLLSRLWVTQVSMMLLIEIELLVQPAKSGVKIRPSRSGA